MVRLTVAGSLRSGGVSRVEKEDREELEEAEESWIEVFVQSMQLGRWGPLKGEDNVDEEVLTSRVGGVGQGPGNNFLVHKVFHVTINANGTLSALVDGFKAACR